MNEDDGLIGQAFCSLAKTTKVNDRRKANREEK